MTTIKKRMLILLFLLLIIASLAYISIELTWPSKAKLCRDLENYLPKTDCINIDSRIEILRQAFPEGSTTSDDVKGALGEYLHSEHSTDYGHLEIYYLSIRPIYYLFGVHDNYIFGYNSDGILVVFSYED